MSPGIEMNEAHFPGRAPINAYGDGGFRFAGMSHKGSILCLPSGIYAWSVDSATHLAPAYFERIIAEAGDIEVLLVGTGLDLLPLTPQLKLILNDNTIVSDPMSTGAAVRTFNVLLAEKRAVAAALIAV